MVNIVFAGEWQKFFAKFGLESFDDFFDYSQGKTINRNNKRNVSELAFGEGDNRKVFFRKRFFSPHVKDMIFAWRSYGKFISQAALEWSNANILFENGIETYRPVCYGAQRKYSLERKSFFITEKLPGTALTDFVSKKWEQLSRQQK
ncbi:MAG: lipopolysaccharide kinase InaA family protein, partial [Planctomycetota bacterium]